MACLDENAIALLVEVVEGHLALEVRQQWVRHLDDCAACREAVGSFVRLVDTTARDSQDMAFAATIASERPPPPTSRGDVIEAGAVLAQRYRLERIVGEGGLGVVWAARHVVTQKAVALKVLKFRDPELCRRFLREARVSAALRHPAVVDVHDVFQIEPDGQLVMVMDLLEGESLDRLLARRGSLPVSETLLVMRPVLSALAAAHALGVVHRDLKPHNIFLENAPGFPRAKLLDFGLAKLTASDGAAAATAVLTREATVMGTPGYMAPEQLYGEMDIDSRADVWAIGVILFECLTGRRPVDGGTVGQMLKALATRELPQIATLAPGLPPALATSIDVMLTRDRANRPRDIAPLIALVESLVPGS